MSGGSKNDKEEGSLTQSLHSVGKGFSSSNKKIKRQRAAAKIDVAPIHPIFAKAAALTHDSLWKDILLKMSKNIYRKGFRYYPLVQDSKKHHEEDSKCNSNNEEKNLKDEEPAKKAIQWIGRLTFRAKSKDYECAIGENAEEVLKEVKKFMASHIGLISDAEQEELDESIRDLSLNPLDVLPKSWEEVKTEGSRNILIRHYADEFRKRYQLTNGEYLDLLTTLHMGIASEILNEKNISLKNGAIDSIRGVIFDHVRKEFYISTECIFPFPPLQLRRSSTVEKSSKLVEKKDFSSGIQEEIFSFPRDERISKKCSVRILASAVYLHAYRRCETFLVEQMVKPHSLEKNQEDSKRLFFFPTHTESVVGNDGSKSVKGEGVNSGDLDIPSITILPPPRTSMSLMDSYAEHLVPINLVCAAAASIATAEWMGNKTSLTVHLNSPSSSLSLSDEKTLESLMSFSVAEKEGCQRPFFANAVSAPSIPLQNNFPKPLTNSPMSEKEVFEFLDATSRFSIEIVKREMVRLEKNFSSRNEEEKNFSSRNEEEKNFSSRNEESKVELVSAVETSKQSFFLSNHMLLIPVPIQRFLECLTLFITEFQPSEKEKKVFSWFQDFSQEKHMRKEKEKKGEGENGEKVEGENGEKREGKNGEKENGENGEKGEGENGEKGEGEKKENKEEGEEESEQHPKGVWPLLIDKETFADLETKNLRMNAASDYLLEIIQSMPSEITADQKFAFCESGSDALTTASSKKQKKALLLMQAASERVSRSKSMLFVSMIHDLIKGISNGLIIQENKGFRVSGHINPLFRMKG